MNLISKLTAAAAVATIAAGAAATASSAYSISGGTYVGIPQRDNQFSTGGAYTFTCQAALTTFTGTATGADTTVFTPYYGGPGTCDFFGLPVTVTQSGTWSLRVTAGPDSGGRYVGELQVPSGTSTRVDWPLSGCAFDVSGPQSFPHSVEMWNTGSGVELEATVAGISFVVTPTSSCPFASNNDGLYVTNGSIEIPGITIS